MRSSNTQVKGGLHGIAPKFSKGEPVDVFVYLSESQQFAWEGAQLLWQEESVPLADVKAGDYEKSITYVPSESVQNNGSVWLHVLFARHGYPIDPDAPNFNADAVFGRRYPLTEYVPPRKEREGVNLLEKREAADSEEAAQPSEAGAVDVGGIPGEEVEAEVEPAKPWINVWKPNITITMVADFTKYNPSAIPPQVKPVLDIDHRTDTYWPTVWFDDFWLLRNYMIPVNDTVPELQLHLGLGSTPVWWWTLLQQLESSFQTQVDSGLMSDTETDEFKRILLEGNPYLLALTFVVSILHSVFDFLAFKNDIGFWRNNKSMEGLSGRTILINSFCQLVIFLYLLDNDTSFVVLLSSGVGMCIEFWKVTKAYDVSLKQEFPFLSIKDRVSYVESMTKKYDDEASKYMSWVLYPLVTGYAVYSLVYDKHKSWYSWVVNSLVGAVYAFGFILMCPQLYLNYKLKSVAHLPWRQMTYKFLNTIIDDLFAFVIKMPLLHRLSVFRDDVIFLIYLYQRWIYPVDKLRVNEFGFSAEPPPEATEAEEKPPEQLQSAADTGDDAPAESGSEGLRQRVKAKASEAAQEGEECADGDSSELPKKDK